MNNEKVFLMNPNEASISLQDMDYQGAFSKGIVKLNNVKSLHMKTIFCLLKLIPRFYVQYPPFSIGSKWANNSWNELYLKNLMVINRICLCMY